MTTVYLAGCRGQWREEVVDIADPYELHEWINPFTDNRQGALYEFTHDDLQSVENSDVVFAYLGYSRFEGLAVELGYARALDKTVVLTVDPEVFERVPPMLASISSSLFVSLKTASDFTGERLLDGGDA